MLKMAERANATFEITSWQEAVYDAPPEGSKLLRATVLKRFQGDLDATSAAELMMVRAGEEGGEGYIATERITGRVGGWTGSFVIQHGGVDSRQIHQFGYIVKDSGTGDLRGIVGTCHFQHDETGAHFTLDYDLPAR
jgi:hypothetical protein